MNPDQIEEVRIRLNLDVTVSSDPPAAPAPIESFNDMCLHPRIMKDIAYNEYARPASIQAQAMPIALSGRDLLGCAETGSGKTAAFTIPMIQHRLVQPPIRRGDGPLALVLAPTRELAQQIEKEVQAFSRSLESLKTAIVVGGTNIEKHRSELRVGVEITVATTCYAIASPPKSSIVVLQSTTTTTSNPTNHHLLPANLIRPISVPIACNFQHHQLIVSTNIPLSNCNLTSNLHCMLAAHTPIRFS